MALKILMSTEPNFLLQIIFYSEYLQESFLENNVFLLNSKVLINENGKKIIDLYYEKNYTSKLESSFLSMMLEHDIKSDDENFELFCDLIHHCLQKGEKPSKSDLQRAYKICPKKLLPMLKQSMCQSKQKPESLIFTTAKQEGMMIKNHTNSYELTSLKS